MNQRIQRIYVDTSVVNGAFAQRFAQDTLPFWNAVRRGEIIILASDLLADELENAPTHVREFFDEIPISQIERIVLTEETENLAAQYIAEKVVGQSSLDDCRHIALATIARADVMVSWNFKHIVNTSRIRGYNGINMKLGYPQIDIRTPYEVYHDET